MVPRQYHLLKEAPSKISSLVFPHFHLIISAEEWGKVKNGCSDAQGPSRALLLLRLSQSFILEWLSWRCNHSPDRLQDSALHSALILTDLNWKLGMESDNLHFSKPSWIQRKIQDRDHSLLPPKHTHA